MFLRINSRSSWVQPIKYIVDIVDNIQVHVRVKNLDQSLCEISLTRYGINEDTNDTTTIFKNTFTKNCFADRSIMLLKRYNLELKQHIDIKIATIKTIYGGAPPLKKI